jgi:predicted phage tail protein
MKTVILEGFLGDKYGREWSIVGNTYADIFGCISANYPEFRYDLINYYEAGGGLAILEGEKLLQEPEEVLYEVTADTIIVTPIPEGSKSGGAKILAAIAIVASTFFILGPALAIGGVGTALSGAAGLTAQLIVGGALTLAVNLAIIGIQQLLAPDPSVDQNDQDYLFSGPETVIASGNPVPILCGEMIIGGILMSTSIKPGVGIDSIGHIGGMPPGTGGTIGLPGSTSGSLGGSLSGVNILTDWDITGVGIDLGGPIISAGLEDPDPSLLLYSAQTYTKPWVARESKTGVSFIAPVISHEIESDDVLEHRKSVLQYAYKEDVQWENILDTTVGILPSDGVLFKTFDNMSISAAGNVASNAVTGSSAFTFAGMTLSGEASAAYIGTSAFTFADMTYNMTGAFTGSAVFSGSANVSFNNMTISAAGSASFIGTLSTAYNDMTISAAGLASFVGASSVTFDSITISAAGTNADPSGINFGTAVAAWDPDAGADSSGLIPDAIGSATLYARSGASANANWNGEFEVNTDIVVLPEADSAAIFGTASPITLSLWRLTRSDTASFCPTMTYASTNTSDGGVVGGWMLMREGSTNSAALRLRHQDGYGAACNSDLGDSFDTWQHIVCTIGANNWRIYVDGVLQDTSTWHGTPNNDTNVAFTIGGHYPTGNTSETANYGSTGTVFEGRVGDVRVFHEVLDATEIEDLYTAGRQSY